MAAMPQFAISALSNKDRCLLVLLLDRKRQQEQQRQRRTRRRWTKGASKYLKIREENEADDPVPAPENVELDTSNENVAPNYSIEGKKPNKKRKIERLSYVDKAILKLMEGPKETASSLYGSIIALTMEKMNLSAMDQATLFTQMMGVIDNFKRSDQ